MWPGKVTDRDRPGQLAIFFSTSPLDIIINYLTSYNTYLP